MSARFEGKAVLVAGGTGGLGRAVSLAFLRENAVVVVTYRLSRAAVRAMLKEGHGAIVNVASKAALDHAAGAAAYAASKAAAVAMMDSLAADMKGCGIRVNTILPSIIDTETNRKAMPKADFAKWPKPEDIARVILFLCSDDARVIHGAAIPVYGDS